MEIKIVETKEPSESPSSNNPKVINVKTENITPKR